MSIEYEYHLTLEGDQIHNRSELYDALETLLGKPEVFGRNLDALHDVLTDLLPSHRIALTVRNFPALQKELGRYALAFRGMLTDLSEDDERFTVKFTR